MQVLRGVGKPTHTIEISVQNKIRLTYTMGIKCINICPESISQLNYWRREAGKVI